MVNLFLTLLGGFELTCDDLVMGPLETDKTRALLAFLATERQLPHRRDHLAALFWPHFDDYRARRNLSQACYALRSSLNVAGAPVPPLIATRQIIELHPDFPLAIDVGILGDVTTQVHQHRHEELTTCDHCLEALVKAISYYQGEFLVGFSLDDTEKFEEWLVMQRERLRNLAAGILTEIATIYEKRDDLANALTYARRLAEIAPFQEINQRRVMRLLALLGLRSQALAYYDSFAHTYRKELGIEPMPETRWLYDAIRNGQIRPAEQELRVRPLSLQPTMATTDREESEFVGRYEQLRVLSQALERTSDGEGQVVFIQGVAGVGKTELMRFFARQSHQTYGQLLTLWGQGTALTGSGEPFAPWRQALDLLLGQAIRGYQRGLLTEAQAQRLWAAMPQSIDTLITHAPRLIDTLVPGSELMRTMSNAIEGDPPWLLALRSTVAERKAHHQPFDKRSFQSLIIDYLLALSSLRPLVILLDDVHWADSASLSLAHQLARDMTRSRILLVMAFRPEEIGDSRQVQRHPLRILMAETKRLQHWYDIDLDVLDAETRRHFVDLIVDSEFNTLDDAFRQTLFNFSQGHALFTVEALRECRSHQDIAWDDARGWIQIQPVELGTLPARVEGVIEARLQRLEPHLQTLLAVASVTGERFSAQVLASALDQPLLTIIDALGNNLARSHNLVRSAGSEDVQGMQVDYYEFQHALFRQHLYTNMDEAERRSWHRKIGEALELLFGPSRSRVATQLAHHFYLAGEDNRAITYLLKAGDQARAMHGFEVAVESYERALELARRGEKTGLVARIQMRLGLLYHQLQDYDRAHRLYSEGIALWNLVSSVEEPEPKPSQRPLQLLMSLGPRQHKPTFDYLPDLFSGLVEETADHEIVPDVAWRWEILDAGRTYVFFLRDDVRWSDGVPLTAFDFALAWQQNRESIPTSGAPFYDIKGLRSVLYDDIAAFLKGLDVHVPHPQLLEVRLPRATSFFLNLLTHPFAFPMPRHIVAQHGANWAQPEHVVCNGAFRLASWGDGDDDRYTFDRNPHYHGRYRGNVARVDLLPMRQTLSWHDLLALYMESRIDAVHTFAWPIEGQLKARVSCPQEYVIAPFGTTYAWCLDTRQPPFDDERVRRSFTLGLDRIGWVRDSAYTKVYHAASGGVIPRGVPGHQADIGLPYDPERSLQLLAEAGYANGVGLPPIRIALFAVPGPKLVQQLLPRIYWSRLPEIDIRLEILDWNSYWRKVQSSDAPHVSAMNFLYQYADLDSVLRVGMRTAQRLTGWHDDAYDELIHRAGEAREMGERMRLYQQADVLVTRSASIIPLAYHDQSWLVKPYIKEFPLTANMTSGLAWKHIVMGD